MKNLLLLGLLSTIYACSHPIEIVGEGDVLSATGTRNCYLEDFQAGKENCTKNLVQGAYNETYYAVPRLGWEFDQWINYCADAVSNECAFAIPADAVQNNWGTTVPALVAVFNRLPVTPPVQPPTFPTVDQDGNVSFATAKVVSDQSVTNDTVSSSSDADYFKFTAGETAYYSVALEFSIPNVSLYFYNDDANATLVGESRTSGATKQIVEGKRLEKGKTYYIGVQAISQQEIQNYKLTISRGEVIPVVPVVFNDGGSHLINYNISTGVRVEETTEVTIADGATISGPEEVVMTVIQGSTIIIEDGHIRGKLDVSRGSGLQFHDGTIESVNSFGYPGIYMTGGSIGSVDAQEAELNVSGGIITKTSLYDAFARISGGTYGSIRVLGDSIFESFGGRFEGDILANARTNLKISGGVFLSTIDVGNEPIITFYGDLARTEPVPNGDFSYITTVIGTLLDGNQINQDIACGKYLYTQISCDHVKVSAPPFGSADEDGNVSFDSYPRIVADGSSKDTVSSPSDADYYYFRAQASGYYSASLEFATPNMSLYWYNDDANKTLVGESNNAGAISQEINNKYLTKGQSYYFGVQAVSQSAPQIYNLTLTKD